jgi:hypothetical protein
MLNSLTKSKPQQNLQAVDSQKNKQQPSQLIYTSQETAKSRSGKVMLTNS